MRGGVQTLAVALLLAANLSAAPADNASEYPYRTQANDTLIGLSRRLLKDPRQWAALQKRNAIAAPTRIPVGTAILIPRDWLRDTPETALVTAVVGAVSGDGVPLKAGDRLHEGEKIGTAARAYLTITLADGSLVNLSSSGSIDLQRLRRYVGTGRRDTELKLNQGGLELHVKPQGEAGRFQIRTPVALSAVRGTEFRRTMEASTGSAASLDKTEVIGGLVNVSGESAGAGASIATGASASVAVPGGYGTISDARSGPGAPVKLLPPPDLSALPRLFDDDAVRVIFSPVPGAAGYRAQVASDANFESVVAETTATAPALRFDGLPDARYFLRIRSRDAQGLDGTDAVHPFERHRLLGPPQPEEPRADDFVTGDGAAFRWAAVGGASAYRFQLAADPEFTRITSNQDQIPAATLTLPQIAPGTYYWRIAGVDAGGQAGKWSAAQRYRQKRPPAPLPAPTLNSKLFELSWAGEPGQRYDLQVARDPEFRQIVDEQRLTAARATLKPLGAGVYYVRSRATDDDGYAGSYTPPRRFVAPLPWWAKLAPLLLVIPFL